MGRMKRIERSPLDRIPLDRLPYFMRRPSAGPARRKAPDRSMPKPKNPLLGLQFKGPLLRMKLKGPQQNVQPKGPPPEMQAKGPTPDVQPKGPPLDMQPKGPTPDVHPKDPTPNAQPKGRPLDRVHPVSKMTAIMFWDLAPDVDYYQVKNLLKDINGVIDISFSSTRHRAVVHFATSIAAQAALYQLTGSCLMGRPLKFAWFNKNSYDPNRDTLPAMELLPGRVPRTIYIEGFDSSLSVTEVRSMLKSHFVRSRLHGGRIITPQRPDGTSTGKAFVSFQSHSDLAAAVEQDRLDLGDGCKLLVTRWLELLSFPLHQKIVHNVGGSHVNPANWATPSTGKRTVLE